MKRTFKIKGRIVFDPPNITGKHKKQGEWKKVALLEFSGDIKKYYRWFIKKRYNLILGEPIRQAHITFINDRHSDMTNDNWGTIKKKWNGKSIEITLSTDVRGDGINWWLVVPEESRKGLHDIRAELGLSRPYFGLHMTIGVARDAPDKEDNPIANNQKIVRGNEVHSRYIHGLLVKGLIK